MTFLLNLGEKTHILHRIHLARVLNHLTDNIKAIESVQLFTRNLKINLLYVL